MKLEYLCLIILICVILILIVKICLMRKSLREITEKFDEKINSDTNTLIDITSRDGELRRFAKKLNKQLYELREMKLNYSRGDLELKQAVTNISHDLRTPLTAICGYLDLLEREELTENSKKYLGVVRERTNAMKALTEELFKYSIIISENEQPVLEEVCLNSALEESIAAFYALFCEREIVPKIDITSKKITRIIDKKYLARILSNVLSNALKYSDKTLEISLSDEGEIRFSNDAPALDEITVGRLFDRFYTVENAAGGTGIGLSIAKELTEKMGGEIKAGLDDGKVWFWVKF